MLLLPGMVNPSLTNKVNGSRIALPSHELSRYNRPVRRRTVFLEKSGPEVPPNLLVTRRKMRLVDLVWKPDLRNQNLGGRKGWSMLSVETITVVLTSIHVVIATLDFVTRLRRAR